MAAAILSPKPERKSPEQAAAERDEALLWDIAGELLIDPLAREVCLRWGFFPS